MNALLLVLGRTVLGVSVSHLLELDVVLCLVIKMVEGAEEG